MNMTTPATTPFVESVRWLETRCESVPAGWQLAYNDMLCKLVAADCPARAKITVCGPYMDDLNLRVTQSAPDPVIAGILRRLERATAQTCEACGRPGKLRCLDRTVKVLCGHCAGPRLAFLALTRVMRDLDKTENGSPDEEIWWQSVPVLLRPLIPASAWQVFDIGGVESPVRYTSTGRLQKHRTWLDAVRRALDEAP
jgi:hypothetical protein